MKEVAKAQVDPVGGSFERNLIPPIYACVQVQHLLKSSYEDQEIDIPLQMGSIALENALAQPSYGINKILYYLVHSLRHLRIITC
jgi:hypothetical protein